MSAIIKLDGMTEQQRWLAQQLWMCDSLEDVAEFRDSIDESMWHDMYLVMELIFLADVDSYVVDESDCRNANAIIEQLKDDPNV